jgi:hypothetical protein
MVSIPIDWMFENNGGPSNTRFFLWDRKFSVRVLSVRSPLVYRPFERGGGSLIVQLANLQALGWTRVLPQIARSPID